MDQIGNVLGRKPIIKCSSVVGNSSSYVTENQAKNFLSSLTRDRKVEALNAPIVPPSNSRFPGCEHKSLSIGVGDFATMSASELSQRVRSDSSASRLAFGPSNAAVWSAMLSAAWIGRLSACLRWTGGTCSLTSSTSSALARVHFACCGGSVPLRRS